MSWKFLMKLISENNWLALYERERQRITRTSHGLYQKVSLQLLVLFFSVYPHFVLRDKELRSKRTISNDLLLQMTNVDHSKKITWSKFTTQKDHDQPINLNNYIKQSRAYSITHKQRLVFVSWTLDPPAQLRPRKLIWLPLNEVLCPLTNGNWEAIVCSYCYNYFVYMFDVLAIWRLRTNFTPI